ncbi:hypothetical protein MKX01_035944 [Papaver californicum]|nr:hypothetical protein MKX01_035944 [Papaver californicum]
MKELREKELEALRGDGTGVRKLSDRIHDYDAYLARPKFGGESSPYPRRCRTGRLPTDTNINVESRVEKPLPIYVPRDEDLRKQRNTHFLEEIMSKIDDDMSGKRFAVSR